MRVAANFICLAALLMLNGCYAFSSFQSAKTIEKGRWQATASYSSNSFSNNGNSDHTNNTFEAQLRTGMTEKSDIGIRYARVFVDQVGDYNFVGIEPKLMLVPNQLSFYMPISMYFGKNVNEDERVFISVRDS